MSGVLGDGPPYTREQRREIWRVSQAAIHHARSFHCIDHRPLDQRKTPCACYTSRDDWGGKPCRPCPYDRHQ